MPNARTASAVDSPTQATFTPAKARASSPYSSNFSRTALTALVEVKTIHSYRPVTRPLIARSIWRRRARRLDRDGRHLDRHRAVRASRSLSAPACSLVRGTSTFQPYSGAALHQDSRSRSPTASPTDHERAGQAGRVRSSRAERGRRPSAAWSPVPPRGDRDRGVARPAVLQQRGRDLAQSPASQSAPACPVRGGERRPVDLVVARRPRCAAARPAPPRTPGTPAPRHARHDLERDGVRATAEHLAHHRVGGQRVAGHQPDHR